MIYFRRPSAGEGRSTPRSLESEALFEATHVSTSRASGAHQKAGRGAREDVLIVAVLGGPAAALGPLGSEAQAAAGGSLVLLHLLVLYRQERVVGDELHSR